MARHRRVRKASINYGMTVVGIDPSLSSTSVCIIPADWEVGEWDKLQFAGAGYNLPKTASLDEKSTRLFQIVQRVVDTVIIADSDPSVQVHVFIEDYAYGLNHSDASAQLHELGGCIKYAVAKQFRRLVTPVGNASWRKILIGKGSGKGIKEVVFDQLQAASGELFSNNDAADAFGVANYGRSELCLPFLTLI